MDVYISKTTKLVMMEDYYNGERSGSYGTVPNTWPQPGESSYGVCAVTASWNGKYFGPPWQTDKRGSDHNEASCGYGAGGFGGRHLADPAYAPVTPPYFYGKAKVRLIYTGSLEDQGASVAGQGPIWTKLFASIQASMSFKADNDEPRAFD